jgi:hypothetical protein
MGSIKKDRKLTYEPPKIYEIDVDMTQAMGASQCKKGVSATYKACSAGNRPASCTNGNRASGSSCKKGTQGTTGCRTGTQG